MFKSLTVPKILLADDSTHAQRMGAKILSAEGIEVIAVSNGDAAVKKLQVLDIDLVLADVYMPGLDGYEVCQWVKSSADHAGLPVVLVVGALEPLMPDRIAQARADGLLKKPFEASAMMDTLRPLIDASMQAKPSRKKFEVDPEKTQPITERTVAIPPPAASVAATEPVKNAHEDTVEIEPMTDVPDFESTIRIPPPKGSKDVRASESLILAGAAAAAAGIHAAASTPGPADPPTVVEPSPLFAEPELPPMAEMAPALPEFPSAPEPEALSHESEAQESESVDVMIPDMSGHSVGEEAMTEFEIPDMSSHDESGVVEEYVPEPEPIAEPIPEPPAPEPPMPEPIPEPVFVAPPEPVAPPPAPKWIAEAIEVTPTDHAKFGPVRPDTPPDWGELLKSVEEGSTSTPEPDATPEPTPVTGGRPSALIADPKPESAASELEDTSSVSETLDLEMPVEPEPPAPEPPPAPPAPPPIDEEALRMAVQLCLENALPGLVDEITSAVLRRLEHS
jgi:CheY-like chemotaxis protein